MVLIVVISDCVCVQNMRSNVQVTDVLSIARAIALCGVRLRSQCMLLHVEHACCCMLFYTLLQLRPGSHRALVEEPRQEEEEENDYITNVCSHAGSDSSTAGGSKQPSQTQAEQSKRQHHGKHDASSLQPPTAITRERPQLEELEGVGGMMNRLWWWHHSLMRLAALAACSG